MSHFYRLFTINDITGEQCGIGSLPMLCKSGRWTGLEFWQDLEAVDLGQPWPHCEVFRAPLVPEHLRQPRYVFIRRPGVALPDLWSRAELLFVSERAKAVLEACDDFDHEFIAAEVVDPSGARLDEGGYYAMNVRRILKIEELGGEIRNEFEMFCPNYLESKYLPVVQRNVELKDKIAQLPIWRHVRNQYVHYISEPTLCTLKAAGLSGLQKYSTYDGLAGEAVGRFE